MDAKEQVAEFDNRHGDYIVAGEWVYYQDGAMREARQPWGVLKEPPEDLYKLNQLKVQFCDLKLQLACDEFNNTKNRILLQTRAGLKSGHSCAPTAAQQEETVSLLKTLKQKVAFWKHRLNTAKTDLENAKPAQLRQREVDRETNRIASEKFLDELDKIEI